MQPRPQWISRSVKRCRLYVDDVEEIVNALHATDGRVKISLPGYDTDGNASDLLSLNGRVFHEIRIRRAEPTYISVSLDDNSGTVSAESDDPETVGVVTKVADLLRRHRRWPSLMAFSYLTTGILFVGGLLAFLVTAQVRGVNTKLGTAVTIIFASAVVLAIVQLVITTWISEYRHTILVCARRRDAPNYWQRNKDALTVNVLVAVLAAVVGFGLGKL